MSKSGSGWSQDTVNYIIIVSIGVAVVGLLLYHWTAGSAGKYRYTMESFAWGIVGVLVGYMLRSAIGVSKTSAQEKSRLQTEIERFRHARLVHKKRREEDFDYFKKAKGKVLREIRDKMSLSYHSIVDYDEKGPASEKYVDDMLIRFVDFRSAVRIAPEDYLKGDNGLEILEDAIKEFLIAVNTIDERKGEEIDRTKLSQKRTAALAWLEKHISA